MEAISRSDSPRSINCGMSLDDTSEKSETTNTPSQELTRYTATQQHTPSTKQNALVASAPTVSPRKSAAKKNMTATQPSSPAARKSSNSAHPPVNGRVTRPRPGMSRNEELEPQLSARWLSDRSQSLRNLPGRVNSEKAPRLPGRGRRQVESDSEEEEDDNDQAQDEPDKSDDSEEEEEVAVEEALDASVVSHNNDEPAPVRKQWTPRKRFVAATRSSEGDSRAFGNAGAPRGGRKPYIPKKRFPKMDCSDAAGRRQAAFAGGDISDVTETSNDDAATPAPAPRGGRKPFVPRKRFESSSSSLSMDTPEAATSPRKEPVPSVTTAGTGRKPFQPRKRFSGEDGDADGADSPPRARASQQRAVQPAEQPTAGRKPFMPRRRFAEEEESKPKVPAGLGALKDQPLTNTSRRRVTDDKTKQKEQADQPPLATTKVHAGLGALKDEPLIFTSRRRVIADVDKPEPPKLSSQDLELGTTFDPSHTDGADSKSLIAATPDENVNEQRHDVESGEHPEKGNAVQVEEETPKQRPLAPRKRCSRDDSSDASATEGEGHQPPNDSEGGQSTPTEDAAAQIADTAETAPRARSTDNQSDASDDKQIDATPTNQVHPVVCAGDESPPDGATSHRDDAPKAAPRRRLSNESTESQIETDPTSSMSMKPSHDDQAPKPTTRRYSIESENSENAESVTNTPAEAKTAQADSAPKPMMRRTLSDNSDSAAAAADAVLRSDLRSDGAPEPLIRRRPSGNFTTEASTTGQANTVKAVERSHADAAPKPMMRRRPSDSSDSPSVAEHNQPAKKETVEKTSHSAAAPKPMRRRRLSDSSESASENEVHDAAAEVKDGKPSYVDAAPKPMMRRRLSESPDVKSNKQADEAGGEDPGHSVASPNPIMRRRLSDRSGTEAELVETVDKVEKEGPVFANAVAEQTSHRRLPGGEPATVDTTPKPRVQRRWSEGSEAESNDDDAAEKDDFERPCHSDAAPPVIRRRVSEISEADATKPAENADKERSHTQPLGAPSYADAAPTPTVRRRLSDSSEAETVSEGLAEKDHEEEVLSSADAAPKQLVQRRWSESSEDHFDSNETAEKDKEVTSHADAAPKLMRRRRLSESSAAAFSEGRAPAEAAVKPCKEEPSLLDAPPKTTVRRKLSENSVSSPIEQKPDATDGSLADEGPRRKPFKPQRRFSDETETLQETPKKEPVVEANQVPTQKQFTPCNPAFAGPAVAETNSQDLNTEASDGRRRKPFQPRKRFTETQVASIAEKEAERTPTVMRSPSRDDVHAIEKIEDDSSESEESSETPMSGDESSLESDGDASGSESDDEASDTESGKSTVQEMNCTPFVLQQKNLAEDTVTSDDETTHRRGGAPKHKDTDGAIQAPRRTESHDSDSESSAETEPTRKPFMPRKRGDATGAASTPSATPTGRWGTDVKAEEPVKDVSQRKLFTPRKRHVARSGSSSDLDDDIVTTNDVAAQPQGGGRETAEDSTLRRKPFNPRKRAMSDDSDNAETANDPQRVTCKSAHAYPSGGVSYKDEAFDQAHGNPFVPRSWQLAQGNEANTEDTPATEMGATGRPGNLMGRREMSGRWSSEYDEGETWANKDAGVPSPPRTPRRPGAENEVENPSQDPQRRVIPLRTNSKSLRFTPERTTSFSRQAPGRIAPSNDNSSDANSVTVLTRGLPGQAVPGTVDSMRAVGLSTFRVQRMESNSGLRQMASAVKAPPVSQDNDAQRNVPGRTISAKALRVTPERTRSGLRRQAPGQIAVSSNDYQQGEVTLLERAGPGRAPLRAASMNLAQTRRAPQRTISSMRREALASTSVAPISEDGGEGADVAPARAPRFSERSAPMRAASMGIVQARQAPLRTISTLRRQTLARQSVSAINVEGGKAVGSTRNRLSEQMSSVTHGAPERRAPMRTISSMRRQALAEQSVPSISEEEPSTRALRFSERSAPMRAASMSIVQTRRAPARTISSMRREALASNSVAPISEDGETGSPSGRIVPNRAASMSLAQARRNMGMRGANSSAAPSLPCRAEEPDRSAPGRTISSKALRVTPERTQSGLRRQLPGRSSATDNEQSGEITVLERADPGRSGPMRAASMGLSMMRRAPQRSVSGLRRQMATPTEANDPQREVPSILDQCRPAAPVRAASMSLSVMRTAPQRSTSGLRRDLPAIQNEPKRGAGRTMSSKALRVTPERTVSGLRRQAPGRSSAPSGDPDSITVLERDDTGSRSALIRAASMNLSAMRQLASSVDSRPSGRMEPQRGVPGRTISSKALRVTPEQTTSGLRRGHPSGSVPARTGSMRIGPAASFRVQRQESMAGLRRMAAIANANESSHEVTTDGESEKRLPARTISAKSLRVTPERTRSLRRQAPGRSAPATENEDGEITVLERDNSVPDSQNGDSSTSEPSRRLPPRTSSSSLRQRQAPGRSFSGMASRSIPARGNSFQRQSPARSSSLSVTAVTRQLPERTSSSRQRMVPSRTNSGMGMRQLPGRTSSGVGTRQLPPRTSSNRQRLAPVVMNTDEDKYLDQNDSETDEEPADDVAMIDEDEDDDEEEDELAPLHFTEPASIVGSGGMGADLGITGGGVRRESLLAESLLQFYSEGIMEESSENADTTEEDTTEVSIEANLRSTDLEAVEEDSDESDAPGLAQGSLRMETLLRRSGLADLMECSNDTFRSSYCSDVNEGALPGDESSSQGEGGDDESSGNELVLVEESDDESSLESDDENNDEKACEDGDEELSSNRSTLAIKDSVPTVDGTSIFKADANIEDAAVSSNSSHDGLNFGREGQEDWGMDTQVHVKEEDSRSNDNADTEVDSEVLQNNEDFGQEGDPEKEQDLDDFNIRDAELDDNSIANETGASIDAADTTGPRNIGGRDDVPADEPDRSLTTAKDTEKDEVKKLPLPPTSTLCDAKASAPRRRGSASRDAEYNGRNVADDDSGSESEQRETEGNNDADPLKQISQDGVTSSACRPQRRYRGTDGFEDEVYSNLVVGSKAMEVVFGEKSEGDALDTGEPRDIKTETTRGEGGHTLIGSPAEVWRRTRGEAPVPADPESVEPNRNLDGARKHTDDTDTPVSKVTIDEATNNFAAGDYDPNDANETAMISGCSSSGIDQRELGDNGKAATATNQLVLNTNASFLWRRDGALGSVAKGTVTAGRDALQSVTRVNTIVSVKFLPEPPPDSTYWPKQTTDVGMGSGLNACPPRHRSTNSDLYNAMLPLDDAASLKDDESIPALDDYASLRDDESMPPDDESMPPLDAMSVRDDESMPDGHSVDDSMPPVSDIASASVQQDDESMPAFDDETTIKDDDISKSENDDDVGHHHLSDVIGNHETRVHGVPPIISTALTSAICNSGQTGMNDDRRIVGGVPPVINTSMKTRILTVQNSPIESPFNVISPMSDSFPIAADGKDDAFEGPQKSTVISPVNAAAPTLLLGKVDTKKAPPSSWDNNKGNNESPQTATTTSNVDVDVDKVDADEVEVEDVDVEDADVAPLPTVPLDQTTTTTDQVESYNASDVEDLYDTNILTASSSSENLLASAAPEAAAATPVPMTFNRWS